MARSTNPRRHDIALIRSDPDAFEAFYREHVESVQRFVARRVDDCETAADLTAEVFLAAIAAAPGYRSQRGTPRQWLFGVARVVVVAERRRGARERRATRRVAGRALLGDDDIARMDERIDAAAQARGLYRALDRLGAGERAVLELVAVDELSVVEAADVLGINPVAARVRLHRARRHVRHELSAAARPASAALTQPTEVAP